MVEGKRTAARVRAHAQTQAAAIAGAALLSIVLAAAESVCAETAQQPTKDDAADAIDADTTFSSKCSLSRGSHDSGAPSRAGSSWRPYSRRSGRVGRNLLYERARRMLNKPLLDIRRAELQLIADSRQSAASASLAIRILRPCLKWAEKRGLVGEGVASLEQPGRARKRDRIVTTDELKALWPHLRGSHGDLIKWLLRTGCRLNEAVGLRAGEISGDVWTIPAKRAKNGRARTVPLPSQAVDLLRVADTLAPDALVFPSEGGGVLSNWDRETKRLHRLSGTLAPTRPPPRCSNVAW
jgi:integrase